jgi:ATP/maltotriose-dependent transcriptional regulator MalT
MRLLISDFRLQIEKRANTDTESAQRLLDYSIKLLAAFGTTTKKSEIENRTSEILIEPLSMRELEVLRLVAAGLSNKAIARRLVVAEETVKKHLKNIYGKLDAHSRRRPSARIESALKATSLLIPREYPFWGLSAPTFPRNMVIEISGF